jgi:hypothetical protein
MSVLGCATFPLFNVCSMSSVCGAVMLLMPARIVGLMLCGFQGCPCDKSTVLVVCAVRRPAPPAFKIQKHSMLYWIVGRWVVVVQACMGHGAMAWNTVTIVKMLAYCGCAHACACCRVVCVCRTWRRWNCTRCWCV